MSNNSTRFQKGRSGNPSGRKKGSRNKLSEKFIADVARDWSKHGKEVLDNVRALQPGIYLRVVASLISKDYLEEQPDSSSAHEGAKERFLRKLMLLKERSTSAIDSNVSQDADRVINYEKN